MRAFERRCGHLTSRPARPLILLAVVVAMAGVGCAWVRHLRPPPPGSRQHVISMRQISAGDALVEGAELLEEETGVHRADADLVRGEIKVWTLAEIDAAPLVRKLVDRRFDAVASAGQGSYLPPSGFPPDSDARILTLTGDDVEDLSAHAVRGKVTVFDFYADWCGPCRTVDRQLRQILATHRDVAVRKLNIVNFTSPLASRWVGNGIPLLLVYDRAGQKVAHLRGNEPQPILAALARAGMSSTSVSAEDEGVEGGVEGPVAADGPEASTPARLLPPHIGTAHRLADTQDPRYRPAIRREHYRGGSSHWGLFKICVSTAGKVTAVSLLKSTGVADIDGDWTRTIRSWPHRPFLLDGAAAPFCYPLRLEVRMSKTPPAR